MFLFCLAIENDDEDPREVTPAPNEIMPTPNEIMPTPTKTTPTPPTVTPTRPLDLSSEASSAGSPSMTASSGDGIKIVIKRGRGAAKTLDLNKLQMPLQQG